MSKSKSESAISSIRGRMSEVRVPLTVPGVLAEQLRRVADRDCSSLAATARRLVAVAVARELDLIRRQGATQ